MGSRIVGLLFFLISSGVSAGLQLSDYPGLELVDRETSKSVEPHKIILGPLKKINNILEPEKFDNVVGTKRSETFFIRGASDVDLVKDFYRSQLLIRGEILFECSGRNCGSSNYWANTIFTNSVLYGPEQFQRYLLVRLEREEYVAVYVAMRGTKKIYVHIVKIAKGHDRKKIERLVFKTSESAISAAREILSKDKELILYVVIHQDIENGKAMEDSIKTSLQIGNNMKLLLEEEDRISIHGVGALIASQGENPNRIDIVVARP